MESSRDPALSTPEAASSMRPRAAFLQSRALRGGNDAKWRLTCPGAATAVTASSAAKAAWLVMVRARTKHRGERKRPKKKSNEMRGLATTGARKEGDGDAAMAMVWGVWRKERKVVLMVVGGGGKDLFIGCVAGPPLGISHVKVSIVDAPWKCLGALDNERNNCHAYTIPSIGTHHVNRVVIRLLYTSGS